MAPYPPYSPVLASSDFFLFGHVKYMIEGAGFSSENTLLAASQLIVPDLTIDILTAIFAKSVERLRRVASNKGHYYRLPKQWPV
jgi:hypothetical protein